ncbi:hypothetical protein [Peribacillus loiseleuriae]|uniref:hypothetical protein n=1 Tax=Peribacillus loiseleuriae TaxID=1679170 RepID=UPI003D04296D
MKYEHEEIEFKFWLLTQSLAELREYISPDYKSRAYELLMLNFSKKEINAIDSYFVECLKTAYTPSKDEFRNKVIEITNGLPFNEESANRLLLAYQHEELFLKPVTDILNS